jgi:hypothetical protein
MGINKTNNMKLYKRFLISTILTIGFYIIFSCFNYLYNLEYINIFYISFVFGLGSFIYQIIEHIILKIKN